MTLDRRADDVEAERERRAALLVAMGHPVRLRLLEEIVSDSSCVGSLVECLGLPQPLVSRHLAILREAGLVVAHKEGRRRRYSVTDPSVPRVLAALRPQGATK